VPGVNRNVLHTIPVCRPPLLTQQKIAAILSTYDELIENNTRRIALLEEMAQRSYREWFVEFRYPGHEGVPLVESEAGLIPEGWHWRTLSDLAQERRRSVDPRSLAGDVPYFGLEHLPERSIALSEWGRASDVASTKNVFEVGDILFGKIRPYFHKVGPPPVAGVCSTDAIVIRPRDESLKGLVLAVVSSETFVQHAVQTSQGTKMPRANWRVLERYPVPVPPCGELREIFEAHMNATVRLIHNFTLGSRSLRATRDLLLPRLISGEIDVEHLDIDTSGLAA
jgi:type I restriction enzyme, S subunit